MHKLCFFLCFLLSGFAEERVFFLHIPKSGGITLRSVLMDRYVLGAEIEVSNWALEDLEAITKQMETKWCVAGHFLYSQVKESVRDFTKVTFLRNPVDRVLSEHRYCYERNHRDPAKMLKGHFLLLEGDPLDTAANMACQFLSRLDPQDPSVPIEEHLESAKAVLRDDFDFVGIMEEMEESVALFWGLMGWKVPEEIPVHNTTNSIDRGYSPDLLQAIAERNWADIELYNFAKELFEQSKNRITSFLKLEPVQWVDRVEYLFSEPLDGFGWCPRESLSIGVFRWLTTPERGCIDFPLIAGKDYALAVELFIQPGLISQLRISINETPLVYTMKPMGNSQGEYRWYRCKATIPRLLLQEGKKTRLEIAIDDTERPPVIDFYRGRCGSRKIAIVVSTKNSRYRMIPP